jgi:urease accessory protein
MIPPLWRLLQTTDSLFPTGAFAHSGGLEGLAGEGILRTAQDAEEGIREILQHSFARVDLPACALAHRAALAGDAGRLVEIDSWVDSLKAPREAREASQVLGRRRLRVVGALEPFRQAVQEERTPGHQAVVVGMQGAVEGMSRAETLLGFFYGAAAGLVASAMKLLPLGQTRAQDFLSRLGAQATGLVQAADHLELEDLGGFLPILDIASMRHEVAPTRLFIS